MESFTRSCAWPPPRPPTSLASCWSSPASHAASGRPVAHSVARQSRGAPGSTCRRGLRDHPLGRLWVRHLAAGFGLAGELSSTGATLFARHSLELLATARRGAP